MQFEAKTVVITGAAKGIGAAIACKFSELGANVVLADTDLPATEVLAKHLGGIAVACDVRNEANIQNLVKTAEDKFGPVDIFCSNAGLAKGQPDHAASATNEVWETCWQVHVMAHVYAARAVLPGMIERGSGHLVQVSSAAGLLNQIGDAAYSTTKHAAVGFAESLAITHGDQGIKVCVVCPQYVATPLLGYDDPTQAPDIENLIAPADVATCLINGMRDNKFLILPHPEVADYIQFKASQYDKWLASMRTLQKMVVTKLGGINLKDIHKIISGGR